MKKSILFGFIAFLSFQFRILWLREMKHRKNVYITMFLCMCSFGLAQDESRDTKQHPELSKV